jgi:hypothetical protein
MGRLIGGRCTVRFWGVRDTHDRKRHLECVDKIAKRIIKWGAWSKDSYRKGPLGHAQGMAG